MTKVVVPNNPESAGAVLPTEDLPLYWQGRANALGLLNDRRVNPDELTKGVIETYEECAKELRAALSPPKEGQSEPEHEPGCQSGDFGPCDCVLASTVRATPSEGK